jgi:hypothetical protein
MPSLRKGGNEGGIIRISDLGLWIGDIEFRSIGK